MTERVAKFRPPADASGQRIVGVRWHGLNAARMRGFAIAGICCAALFMTPTSLAPAQQPAASAHQVTTPGRQETAKRAARRLLAAYPEHIIASDGGALVWRDGTRTPLDDGLAEKSFSAWLSTPDLKDMFRIAYPAGANATAPMPDADPGRARNAAFFQKMYGDCSKHQVAPQLADVAWLPGRSKLNLKVTRVNGVDRKLAAVSAELDALPAPFTRFLLPPAGTYNCRAVAGTDQASAHGYGIAVDISLRHAHYWRWSKPDAAGRPVWRNEIPIEIVRIFEKHGFIWGGRWHHYDTMHFEYRPELLLP